MAKKLPKVRIVKGFNIMRGKKILAFIKDKKTAVRFAKVAERHGTR